jgi:hypothetical protein
MIKAAASYEQSQNSTVMQDLIRHPGTFRIMKIKVRFMEINLRFMEINLRFPAFAGMIL